MIRIPHDAYTISNLNFWKIVFSLFMASFFIFASLYVVHPLMPIFTQEFDVSVSSSSLSLSLTVLGLIIGLIVIGFISDRRGRTAFIKLSLLGTILPFFLMSIVDSFVLLLFLRFVQGFTFAGLPAAALAYIGEEIEENGIGLVTSLYISSNALGGMIGRFVTGYLVETHSLEMIFFLWAIIGGIVLFIVNIALPKSRGFIPIHTPVKQDLLEFLFHLKNPVLILLFILGIILQLSFTGVWTYLPFKMQGAPFYLSLQTISFFYFTYGLGAIGSSVAGFLIKRFNLNKIRALSVLVMSFGTLITLGKSIHLVIIGLGFICLGFFTAHSLTTASVNLIATHHKGSASSLYLASYYVGVSMGSSILAPIWERFGWTGVIIISSILPIIYIIILEILIYKYSEK